MKTDFSIVAALVAILLAVPSANGDCFRAVKACHQEAVVNYQSAAIVQAIPLYGVSYGGPAAGNDGETQRLLAELLAEVKAMNARLDALKGGGEAVPPVESLASPTVQKVLAVHCAECHTGDKAKEGFQLFTATGQPVKLSGPDRKAADKRLAANTMPPADAKAKLSAADRELVRKAMTSK